jgi:hypothetical protein
MPMLALFPLTDSRFCAHLARIVIALISSMSKLGQQLIF